MDADQRRHAIADRENGPSHRRQRKVVSKDQDQCEHGDGIQDDARVPGASPVRGTQHLGEDAWKDEGVKGDRDDGQQYGLWPREPAQRERAAADGDVQELATCFHRPERQRTSRPAATSSRHQSSVSPRVSAMAR